MSCNTKEISTRRMFFALMSIVVLLIGMHFFPESWSPLVAGRFNLDREANVSTWYSTILLFSIALASFAIYQCETGTSASVRPWRFYWRFFGAVYCFLSLDEAACLHEIIDQTTSVKWVYIYAPFGGIFFVLCTFYFAVVRNDNNSLRNWVLGGLVVFACGGLLAELLSYVFRPLPPVLQQIEFVLEEGLEMTGSVMTLMGCFGELKRLKGMNR